MKPLEGKPKMINKFQGEHVDGDDDSPSIPASHHNVASNGNTCKWITTSSQYCPLIAPSFIFKATAREMHVTLLSMFYFISCFVHYNIICSI
jgi:hypothetical protein